jgi:hypothetical protein
MRPPRGKIARDSVFNRPDGASQAGAGLELADVELITEFADRPHGPSVRALDDSVEEVVDMLVAGKGCGRV